MSFVSVLYEEYGRFFVCFERFFIPLQTNNCY